MCLCQLQGVNFIRGTGSNHISTCILRAVPEPEAENMQRGQTDLLAPPSDAQVDHDMNMGAFIESQTYEIIAMFVFDIR